MTDNAVPSPRPYYMEFVPVNDKATNEQIKAAVELCTGIQAGDVFIYIPEIWQEVGTFWGSGPRFGEWDVDGNWILVIEHPQQGEEEGEHHDAK